MKIYEMYFSPTGGTEKVTDILAAAWGQEIVKIDLSMDDRIDVKIEKDAVCIIGAPVFGGRLPQVVVQRLHKLQGNHAKTIVTVVYGNRAYEDALLELLNTVEAAGFHAVGGIAAIAEHSIVHQIAKGRPDQEDRAQLRRFIARMKATQNGTKELHVPGNLPYKTVQINPMIPIVSKDCISCGQCAAKCPVHAISADHPQDTDASACISCMRCIKVCPQHARCLEVKSLTQITKKLSSSCLERKSNACFLLEQSETMY